MEIVATSGTAGAVYWPGRDAAMAAANGLGARFGRPIVTGLGVAQDETSWFVRVDFHSMQDGDTFLIVRNSSDAEQVAAEVQRILDLNQAAIIADVEAMNAAYEKQLEAEKAAFVPPHRNTAEGRHAQRRASALQGWVKRRAKKIMQAEQAHQMMKLSDNQQRGANNVG